MPLRTDNKLNIVKIPAPKSPTYKTDFPEQPYNHLKIIENSEKIDPTQLMKDFDPNDVKSLDSRKIVYPEQQQIPPRLPPVDDDVSTTTTTLFNKQKYDMNLPPIDSDDSDVEQKQHHLKEKEVSPLLLKRQQSFQELCAQDLSSPTQSPPRLQQHNEHFNDNEYFDYKENKEIDKNQQYLDKFVEQQSQKIENSVKENIKNSKNNSRIHFQEMEKNNNDKKEEIQVKESAGKMGSSPSPSSFTTLEDKLKRIINKNHNSPVDQTTPVYARLHDLMKSNNDDTTNVLKERRYHHRRNSILDEKKDDKKNDTAATETVSAMCDNSSEECIDDKKREIISQFDFLKLKYGNTSVIPNVNMSMSYKELKSLHETYVKKVKIEHGTNFARECLKLGFQVIEIFLGKVCRLDVYGFTQSQMENIHNYDTLLIEIGEKQYKPDGGKNVPVELRLVGYMIFQVALFIVSKHILGSATTMMYNSSDQQNQRRKIRRPNNTDWNTTETTQTIEVADNVVVSDT